MTTKLPTLFIPHGGGPCFFMDWKMGPADTWDKMKSWLMQLGESIVPMPKAIVVISAHWESQKVTINNSVHPSMLFDYYGFPSHTYELDYPAPGSASLANQIRDMLLEKNIPTEMDSARGYDHGVFIPLLLSYPKADIPVVQISLNSSLDPAEHISIGRALAPLRDNEVLIIGSGMSYHNLKRLMREREENKESDLFDEWLTKICAAIPSERNAELVQWSKAPAAMDAHPREEHLLPLMVIAGAAGEDTGKQIFTDRVMGATVSAYQFG